MTDIFLGMILYTLVLSIIIFILWWLNVFQKLQKKKDRHYIVKSLESIHKEHIKEKKYDKQRKPKHSNKKDAVKT